MPPLDLRKDENGWVYNRDCNRVVVVISLAVVPRRSKWLWRDLFCNCSMIEVVCQGLDGLKLGEVEGEQLEVRNLK